ncbi:putative serine esterase family protein [Diplocarpon rosae]|nr:putative serine esterase family protein [Diplocarpon rosae]
MLLLHQAGSVKIGEVVRYTVTYTPAHDRILPSPPCIFLKVRNVSAVALRAAFVHGPYTLYTAAYPATFHPNKKFENPRAHGIPEFEPVLKAGGSWCSQLVVPEEVRRTAGSGAGSAHNNGIGSSARGEPGVKSVTWIIEVSSQVIFSNTATVHYEILLGRDEKSLSVAFASSLTGTNAQSQPGQVRDHQQAGERGDKLAKGVFSRAIRVKVDDTASLWNTPRMPEWEDEATQEKGKTNEGHDGLKTEEGGGNEGHRTKRQKKVHLVVLTHGMHSNLGADMLFMKESIDEAAKQAKVDARIRKAKEKKEKGRSPNAEAKDSVSVGKEPKAEEDEDEDEPEVIVRGFSGNSVRTEKGIKYLGKRLAKYVLQMTYPDQPYKPVAKKSAALALSHAVKPERLIPNSASRESRKLAQENSSIVKDKDPCPDKKLPFKITGISFIGHSLGGLIQTYAVAYIQKHSPEFFDLIEPINFIALATPFLGLSNENPMYVKFALDFGLVGRTGQDLGLTWRAPTIARSGWGAIVSGIGEGAHKKVDGETTPEAKPLLRILPTGPAHIVLKKFRNRTVYSNVVNDGVVPLRTSCLLFIDWSGLGRVDKARRANGLVGTMASWGWAELTGANSSSPSRPYLGDISDTEETGSDNPDKKGHGADVPQPPPYATTDDDTRSLKSLEGPLSADTRHSPTASAETTSNSGPLASIIKFFNPANSSASKSTDYHPKHQKIYQRSQTLRGRGEDETSSAPSISQETSSSKTTGYSEHCESERMSAPPKTSFFESAGDIIKPPIPTAEFIINPETRPRTIFHDRVYHPSDVPPLPLRHRPSSSLTLRRRSSLKISDASPSGVSRTDSSLSAKDYDDTKHTNPDKDPRDIPDGSGMRVEEKIARAYHRDLSWRKVLVRLEPDAHNNIVVRRMFSNAYGWPVIKHLCDTHFGDSHAANTRDEDESNAERAKDTSEAPTKDGGEVNEPLPKQTQESEHTNPEAGEARDSVSALHTASKPHSLGKALAGNSLAIPLPSPAASRMSGSESEMTWSEREWADSELDSDEDEDRDTAIGVGGGGHKAKRHSSGGWNWTEAIAGKGVSSPRGTDKAEIEGFLGRKMDEAEGASSPGHKSELDGDTVVARVIGDDEPKLDSGVLDAANRQQVRDSGVHPETDVDVSAKGKDKADAPDVD